MLFTAAGAFPMNIEGVNAFARRGQAIAATMPKHTTQRRSLPEPLP